jgi:hypothetical protein
MGGPGSGRKKGSKNKVQKASSTVKTARKRKPKTEAGKRAAKLKEKRAVGLASPAKKRAPSTYTIHLEWDNGRTKMVSGLTKSQLDSKIGKYGDLARFVTTDKQAGIKSKR